jgi:hypothetical protein
MPPDDDLPGLLSERNRKVRIRRGLKLLGVHLPGEVYSGMSAEALMRLGTRAEQAWERAGIGSCVAPALPALGDLIAGEPQWRYPGGSCAGEYGVARLRVWETPEGHLAVVTETGEGVSVTNAAASIWPALAVRFPGALTVIEHWPASQSPGTGEHYDLMWAPPRTAPAWSRLWPLPPGHPQAVAYGAWMDRWGPQIRETPMRPGEGYFRTRQLGEDGLSQWVRAARRQAGNPATLPEPDPGDR